MPATEIKLQHRNSLQPGYQLHEFVIQDILGQGGNGITYLAIDNKNKRQVAIKEYLPMEMAVREKNASIQPVSGDYGERFNCGLHRFIREAETLSQFRHDNIIHAHGVFTGNNTAYLVMDYNGGRCLDMILGNRKTLSEDQLLALLMPILDGLEYIHKRGFIHRDIKPANILVMDNNTPVLLDFGSARQSLGGQTGKLTTMFTPGYAPFEQYTGKKVNQGPWTDIYGLGATMYKSIIGRAPVDAMARGDALLQIDRDTYVGLLEINPEGYSESFLNAIDKALCFRPSQRPISVSEWRKMFFELETTSVSHNNGFNSSDSRARSNELKLSSLEKELVTICP